MSHSDLETIIDAAFEDRANVGVGTKGEIRDAVDEALDLLDSRQGARRREGAGRDGRDAWKVNQWLKKAVLLSFRLNDMGLIAGGPGGASWWDKVPSKFDGWGAAEFAAAGFRAVPGCVVRRSAFIAPGVVLMPSFVNLGAYVDTGTMVDTWATVGSCAQIGKNVHLSGGVGIGGVLEPLQAGPTIIEDNCFIGARSEVVEGVIVGEGSVLVDGRLHRRLDQDRRPRPPARCTSATCRPIRWWSPATCRASRCRTASPARRSIAPSSSRRVDAQTRVEDRHQRTAEGLMAGDDGQARFRFLYRSDAGVIDRRAWWRGVITLGGLC